VFAICGLALDPQRAIAQFVHTAWTEKEGAPDNIQASRKAQMDICGSAQDGRPGQPSPKRLKTSGACLRERRLLQLPEFIEHARVRGFGIVRALLDLEDPEVSPPRRGEIAGPVGPGGS